MCDPPPKPPKKSILTKVLKFYHNPVGLDYDIDNDPGETISIGSTKSVKSRTEEKGEKLDK
jgi:hypothetical protein